MLGTLMLCFVLADVMKRDTGAYQRKAMTVAVSRSKGVPFFMHALRSQSVTCSRLHNTVPIFLQTLEHSNTRVRPDCMLPPR